MHNINKNNQRYYRIEHANHKSKSGRPVRPYSTSGTLFLLLFNKHFKTLQECTECMNGLFHKISELCTKYGVIKTTEKLPNNA